MANRALLAGITENGLDQGDLVKTLNNIIDAVNELIADHATNIAAIAANKTAVNAVITAAGTDIAAVAAVTPVSASPAASLTSTTLKLTKG